MNPRYTALPVISMILKVLGWLLILAGVLYSVKYLILGVPVNSMRLFDRVWRGHIEAGITALFWPLLGGVLLIGVAESVHVLLDIEENTRRAADAARGTAATCTPKS